MKNCRIIVTVALLTVIALWVCGEGLSDVCPGINHGHVANVAVPCTGSVACAEVTSGGVPGGITTCTDMTKAGIGSGPPYVMGTIDQTRVRLLTGRR